MKNNIKIYILSFFLIGSFFIGKNGLCNVDDSYTKVLLHMNGSDGGTTFTDESGKNWNYFGNAQTDTEFYKFPTASGLFDGNGDYITSNNNADFNFGSENFTIDYWVRFKSNSGNQSPIGLWNEGVSGNRRSWYIIWRFDTNALLFRFTENGSVDQDATFGTKILNINTWYHIALVRENSNLKAFVNGEQLGSTYNIGTKNIFNNIVDSLYIGIRHNNDSSLDLGQNGNIDEFRISKGIARWNTNFTPPTSEYVPQICGNNIIEGTETCDGNSQTCTIGGETGMQSCNETCTGWETCEKIKLVSFNSLGNDLYGDTLESAGYFMSSFDDFIKFIVGFLIGLIIISISVFYIKKIK